jgi:hypothetical protein
MFNKKEYNKRYREKNKKYIAKYKREYREKNKEKIKRYRKEYRKKNKEHIREHDKKYRLENIKYIKKLNKEWEKKNKDKRRHYINNCLKKRRKNNPRFRINSNMSCSVNRVLKGKKLGRKWQNLVRYTTEELMTHLEKQFDDKMNWENYGSYWEIDHIIPKSLFIYEIAESEEFRKCWGLDNLQPLEKSANRKKHNKF